MSQLADALLRKMITDHSHGHKQLQKKHSHKHKATKPQLDTLASTSKHPQVTVEDSRWGKRWCQLQLLDDVYWISGSKGESWYYWLSSMKSNHCSHSRQASTTLSTTSMSLYLWTHNNMGVTSVTGTTSATTVTVRSSQSLMLWNIAWMVSSLTWPSYTLILTHLT